MIRPFTFLTMLLAAGSGLYLYQVKQHGRVIDQQIADRQDATATMRQRAEVLRAEYTLLNDPSRLADLVAAHLPDLKPTLPAQWTSLAELDKRLPPVGASTATPAPLEPNAPDARPPTERAAAPPTASAAPATSKATVPMAAAATHAPLREAMREPVREPPHRTPPPVHAAPPHPLLTAMREHPARRHAPARIATTPLPAPTRYATRSYRPTVPVIETMRTAAYIPPAPQPREPVVASALGMARTMFAPATQAGAAPLSPGGSAR